MPRILSLYVMPNADGKVELWPVSSNVGNVGNNRPDLVDVATVVADGGQAEACGAQTAVAYVFG